MGEMLCHLVLCTLLQLANSHEPLVWFLLCLCCVFAVFLLCFCCVFAVFLLCLSCLKKAGGGGDIE